MKRIIRGWWPRITILTSLFILILMGGGIVLAFTYEGELDPNEFDKWEVISSQPISQIHTYVFIKNPDQTSMIKIVVMTVHVSSGVLGYRYFKNGKPHVYAFDFEQNKYVRIELSREQKQSCKKCHEKVSDAKISI